MVGIGHISTGQWQNPDDYSAEKNRLPYWIGLAKLLEKGKFNALFLADNYGSHDVYQGSHAAAVKVGAQWPINDPFSVISVMAAVTNTLAFGITACSTFEPPFSLARRFSTLDHLTNGRVAWNIVTSWSDNAARAHGLDQLPEHDTRYEMAEEYVNLLYRFWEGSWADGAVVRDVATQTFADPAKVRKVVHHGRFFRSESAHQVDPSPQRTPVLFHAGMSPAGSAFAARHAECVFMVAPSPAAVERAISSTRAQVVAAGREAHDVKFFVQFTAVLGATDEEARDKYDRYRRFAIADGGLAHFSGALGVDLPAFPPNEEFPTDPEHPLLKGLTPAQRGRLATKPEGYDRWTPRLLGEYQSMGGSAICCVGSATTVADEMERWILEGDVDGFNLGHIVVPGAWEDVVEFLTPELEKRGWLGSGDYPVPGGTARENLYETPGDAHLRAAHPGHSYKFRVD